MAIVFFERLSLFWQRVGGAIEEVGQGRVVCVGMDHLRGDGGADVDVGRATALVEGLRGDAQGAQLPADAAEKGELRKSKQTG